MTKVRVRFAPSPTGLLHIGSARTALFNWLFARSEGGAFILRIEDTDLLRSKQSYLDSILYDLQWLGLDWDEGVPTPGAPTPGAVGPYFQMQRLDLYKKYAQELLEKEMAYYCFCSKEALEKEREEKTKLKQNTGYSGKCRCLSKIEAENLIREGQKPVIRFKVQHGITIFDDIVRGKLEFNNDTIEDFIIMKSDGIPVYNFAAAVDDYLMQITHVIRGEEHISNTSRQIMIINALGFSTPYFAHIPIVLNPDKTKLSKRCGASNLRDFKALGYIPDGLVNFLALLGCSYGEGSELMTREEIIKKFSLKKVIDHSAVFDEAKLDAVNASHIRLTKDEDLVNMLKNFAKEELNFIVDKNILAKTAVLYKERIKTLKDFFDKTDFLFADIKEYDKENIEKYFKDDFLKPAFRKLINKFSALENFTASDIERIIRGEAEGLSVKAGKLIHPIRFAVSGRTETAGLFEIMEILGKEKVIKRMKEILWQKKTGT